MKNTEVLVEYVHRNMPNGEFWLDMRVDGEEYAQVGPFDTEGERQSIHDHLVTMMRDLGAKDLPLLPQ